MSLPISEVVKVTLVPLGTVASRRDFSMPALWTSKKSANFTKGRYLYVTDAKQVAAEFGSDSDIYAAAQMWFGSPVRPSRALIGYWAKAGEDGVTESESMTEAWNDLEDKTQNWYGAYYSMDLSDTELMEFHTLLVSSSQPRVGALTLLIDADLEKEESNPIYKIKNMNSGRMMAQLNQTGEKHAGVQLLAEALSTNWAGSNTAKTVKFKEENMVQVDPTLTMNDVMKCRDLGINFYTDYDGVPMLAEGVMIGGRFIDEITGLDAFADAVQKEAFAVLKRSPKIPLTDKGQQVLISYLNRVGYEFGRNGFLAGGRWNGIDFGDLENGDIMANGYYFWSDSYNTQNIPDREARKGMPVMCAVKLAGAIHSLDILINFDR